MNGALVIGVGNPVRGDDGIGAEVVRRIEALGLSGVEGMVACGEGTELMGAWQGRGRVYIVDAVRANGAPGAVHRIDTATWRVPGGYFRYSSHAFGLAEAVELARVLGELPESLVIYGVEGESYSAGAPLSPAVAAGVDEVVARLHAELLAPDGEAQGRETGVAPP
jgi:hydrogenase maturation protease